MFWITLCYLGTLAGLLFAEETHLFHLWMLAILHPLFVLETFTHAAYGHRIYKQDLLFCLLPALRLGCRDHADRGSLWLPRIGWSRVNAALVRRMETAFSGPMIAIALAALPLLGFEYYLLTSHSEPPWHLIALLKVSESVIWVAFASELILMLSIVPQRFRYCRQHWIDILIICLPLISCLRVFRLGRMLRLHQVSRVGRVYRLRGLGTRVIRGAMMINVLRRLRGGDARRLAELRQLLTDKEADLEQLRAEIAELESALDRKS
jgi:voltage-gated potassium channel